MPTDLSGKHAVVMGLGRFGGGAGAARYAAEHGARVTISDRAQPADLANGLVLIEDLISAGSVACSLGEHDPAVLEGADLLIVNPAVPRPWNNPFIRRARDLGVRIETEIGLAIDESEARLAADGPVIAVTGSVGKSTTAAMIAHALDGLGHPAVLAGNIGGSLLTTARTLPEDTTLVVELSSAMLYWLKETRPTWAPSTAVLTGFEANHLDWHADLAHYRASKQHLLDALEHLPSPTAILGPGVTGWPTPSNTRRVTPANDDPTGSALQIDPADMTLPGAHNRVNAAMAAAAVTATLGTDPREAARAAGTFPGLPHRLQWAGLHRGVHCYNDSKSTTPGTTAAAVRALRERHENIWLIAGGAEKGTDLALVATLGTAGILTIGATGPALAGAARAAGANATECATLDQAVRTASDACAAGDALLLSPACASWDQFTNYEARGDAFTALIKQHLR